MMAASLRESKSFLARATVPMISLRVNGAGGFGGLSRLKSFAVGSPGVRKAQRRTVRESRRALCCDGECGVGMAIFSAFGPSPHS